MNATIGLLLAALSIAGIESTRLPCGLEVIVVPDSTAARVQVQLWFRVGLADEPVGQGGVCRLAHAMVAGSAEAGGVLMDGCWFVESCAAAEVRKIVVKHGERLRPRVVTAAEVERVRGMAAAQGGRAGDAEWAAALFGEHGYARALAAAVDEVEADVVLAFLRRWFVPANAVLVVVGDVQPVTVIGLAREELGDLPQTAAPMPRRTPEGSAGTIDLAPRPAAARGMELTWVTPPLGAFDNAAIDVLMQRLCNPVDGLLARRLREMGCAAPEWERESWRDAGIVTLTVVEEATERRSDGATEGGEARRYEDIGRVVDEALAAAAAQVPAEIELNRARALAERGARLRLNGFAAWAHALGEAECVAGNLGLVELRVSRVRAVRVGDLQRAAERLRATRLVRRPFVPTSSASALASQPAEPSVAVTCEGVEGTYAEHVRYSVCPQPHWRIVEVQTRVAAGEMPALPMRDALRAGFAGWTVEQVQDYLTYHGLDLVVREEDGVVVSRGPGSHVAQMLELHAELLRAAGVMEDVRITICGDVDPEEAAADVRFVWGAAPRTRGVTEPAYNAPTTKDE